MAPTPEELQLWAVPGQMSEREHVKSSLPRWQRGAGHSDGCIDICPKSQRDAAW
jgi:hypothetical protein